MRSVREDREHFVMNPDFGNGETRVITVGEMRSIFEGLDMAIKAAQILQQAAEEKSCEESEVAFYAGAETYAWQIWTMIEEKLGMRPPDTVGRFEVT